MSQNLRLVEYFVSKFYDKITHQLEHVVDEDFTYQINGREHIGNFEEYAREKSISAQFGEYEVNLVETKDDRLFSISWHFKMLDEEGEEISMLGGSQIIAENEKIMHIRVFVDEKAPAAILLKARIGNFIRSQNPHWV